MENHGLDDEISGLQFTGNFTPEQPNIPSTYQGCRCDTAGTESPRSPPCKSLPWTGTWGPLQSLDPQCPWTRRNLNTRGEQTRRVVISPSHFFTAESRVGGGFYFLLSTN